MSQGWSSFSWGGFEVEAQKWTYKISRPIYKFRVQAWTSNQIKTRGTKSSTIVCLPTHNFDLKLKIASLVDPRKKNYEPLHESQWVFSHALACHEFPLFNIITSINTPQFEHGYFTLAPTTLYEKSNKWLQHIVCMYLKLIRGCFMLKWSKVTPPKIFLFINQSNHSNNCNYILSFFLYEVLWE